MSDSATTSPSGRAKPPCPVCGDPNAYPLWVSATAPKACPEDKSWHEGGPITIRNVTECPAQMGRAAQAAEFRRLVPDAFDATGTMLPGHLYRVLEAYARAHPGRSLTI